MESVRSGKCEEWKVFKGVESVRDLPGPSAGTDDVSVASLMYYAGTHLALIPLLTNHSPVNKLNYRLSEMLFLHRPCYIVL